LCYVKAKGFTPITSPVSGMSLLFFLQNFTKLAGQSGRSLFPMFFDIPVSSVASVGKR
jgi:hypothetical protein